MDRGTFHSIRDKQEIDKYDALNTYVIFLDSTNQPGFNNGVSAHNDFKQVIPDNGTSHIKLARCRVRNIILPKDSMEPILGQMRLEKSLGLEGLVKNSYIAGHGKTGSYLTSFIMKPIFNITTTNVVVPAVTTTLKGVNTAQATGLPLVDIEQGSIPQVWDSQNNQLVDMDNIIPYPIIEQATYNHPVTTQTIGSVVGDNLSQSYTTIENPFGKEFSVKIFDVGTGDQQVSQFVRNTAGEGTQIELEVQLLPDSQRNDRFNY